MPRSPRYPTPTSHPTPNDPSDADDERSLSDQDLETVHWASSRRPPHRHIAPTFPGQDTRPTSRKELLGWYSYAWAAEVYVICGISSFIPVTLEQLARENGVLLEDGVTPCVGGGLRSGDEGSRMCVVDIWGVKINTASFAMYTFSISVFLQLLVIISMSGAADHGAHRKQLLLIFAIMGSIATMLFIFITPRVYTLASLWAIIGNVGFGASFVLLNAFLPVLVRNHPKILYSEPPAPPHTESTESHSLLTDTPSPNGIARNSSHTTSTSTAAPTPSLALSLSTQISSYGIAIGYAAAVVVQIFSIFLVLLQKSTTASLQLVIFLIGLWWLLFTLPSFIYLRSRPGPPLPSTKSTSITSYITHSWHNLYSTLLRARQLRDVTLFLLSWFLISDAIATVSNTAILFAKTSLSMSSPAIALISIISTLTGILGAFTWPRITTHFSLTPSQTITTILLLFLTIPLYGLLGFIPFIRDHHLGGLTTQPEMYALAAVYGFVMGGLSGYCRSVFGELVPPGSEAAFFALYAVTDKGSSVFGPTVVGLLTDRFGDVRVGFWVLVGLVGLPMGILRKVDVERGRREAGRVAKEEEVGRVVVGGDERGGREV